MTYLNDNELILKQFNKTYKKLTRGVPDSILDGKFDSIVLFWDKISRVRETFKESYSEQSTPKVLNSFADNSSLSITTLDQHYNISTKQTLEMFRGALIYQKSIDSEDTNVAADFLVVFKDGRNFKAINQKGSNIILINTIDKKGNTLGWSLVIRESLANSTWPDKKEIEKDLVYANGTQGLLNIYIEDKKNLHK